MKTMETLSPTRATRVKQAKQQIDDSLKNLTEAMRQGKSEELKRYLAFFAQFHDYSLGNIILAWFQRPDFTRLAGIKKWNSMGRTVKRGEHGISILAPITVKLKERERYGEEEARGNSGGEDKSNHASSTRDTMTYFKPVYVFDVAQTEGEELPKLTNARGDASTLLPLLESYIRVGAAIEVKYVKEFPGRPGVKGRACGGKIEILASLTKAERFHILVHEYAHEVLRHRVSELNKQVRETEADATAYVVCQRFGIESNTSDYLLFYDAKPELIYERLEAIRQTAGWIISRLEDALNDLPATA